MQSVIITSKTKSGAKMLKELASELGYSFEILTKEQEEDFLLARAIKEGETGKYVNTKKFVSKLRGK